MNLVLRGMQQDNAASPTGIIHRVIIGLKYGRSVQNETGSGRGDYFEADLTSGHKWSWQAVCKRPT